MTGREMARRIIDGAKLVANHVSWEAARELLEVLEPLGFPVPESEQEAIDYILPGEYES